MSGAPRELVDELLADRRWHGSVDRPDDRRPERSPDRLQHAEEEREHDDLQAVLGGLLADLAQAPELGRVGREVGRLPHLHQIARADRGRVGLLVRGRQPHPVLHLDLLRQLGEDVLLVAPQVHGRDRAAERAGTRECVRRVHPPRDLRLNDSRPGCGTPRPGSPSAFPSGTGPAGRRAPPVATACDLAAAGFFTKCASSTISIATPAVRTSAGSRASVPNVVTATPPSCSHRRAARSRSEPWRLCAVRRLCLAVSLSQLICTLAGQTTRNRRWPFAARCASTASACTVLPSPISSPRIDRSWWIAYCAPNDLIATQGRREQAGVQRNGSDLLVQLLGDEPAGGLPLVGPPACAHGREDGVHRRCVGPVAVPELVGWVTTRIDGALALCHGLLKRLCRRFREECVKRASAFNAAFFVDLPAKNIFSRLPARSASSASGAVRAVKSCSGPRRVAAVPSAARIAARVGEQPGLAGVGVVRVETEAGVVVHLYRGQASSLHHLVHRLRTHAGNGVQPVVLGGQHVGDRAKSRPFELVESHSPAGDLLERTERLLPQTSRDGLGIEDLDLLPGALAQRNRCAEQCGGSLCEAADGFEGCLRSCADPRSRDRDRLVVALLLSRHVLSAPSVGSGPTASGTYVGHSISARPGSSRSISRHSSTTCGSSSP